MPDAVYIGMLEIKVKTGNAGWLGDILVALSLANLLLIEVWLQLINSASYFLPDFTWHNYVAAAIQLAVFSTLILLVLRLFRNAENIAWKLILLIPFVVVFVFIINSLRVNLTSMSLSVVFEKVIQYMPELIAVTVVIIFMLALERKNLIAMVYTLLLIFSSFAFLNIYHISTNIVSRWIDPPPNFEKTFSVADVKAIPKTVYVIFNELDYRFFFKDKFDSIEGIDLKNFEYMKQNTLFFNNVKNMWHLTIEAIPSITMGEDGKKYRMISPRRDIELTTLNGEKRRWSESDTIFNMVKENNNNVAIIGNYHPYCEIFYQITDYCKSFFSEAIDPNASRNILDAIVAQTISLLPRYGASLRIDLHKQIEALTLTSLGSDKINFIYVHDSIPDSPIIWSAQRREYAIPLHPYGMREFSTAARLINNVQLVDDFLGRIINRLKEKGIWDTSTLIISSDLRWRSPDDGKRYENIPLLIKLPMQKTGYQYDKEVLPTRIKAIIEQIVVHKVHSPVALMRWLDQ